MAKKSTNQQNIITHFPNEETFVKRIWELMTLVDTRNTVVVTPFLPPDKQRIVRQLTGNNYQIMTSGFYSDAEQCKIAIAPLADDTTVDFGICQLVSSYPARFQKITHRDVLGALMQLGLDREQFGDIAINDAQIGIAVNVHQSNYIISNLTQIHRLNVLFALDDAPVAGKVDFEEHTYMMSSLRLDALVAEIVHLSRQKAKEMVVSGMIKVNHCVIENADELCNNKYDIISVRGVGRFQIMDIGSTTRKGNYPVTIRQFK